MTTYHAILGTTDQSTKQDIKKRYRKLSNQCHPDKDGSAELFKLVKLAYEKVISGLGNQKAFDKQTSNTGYNDAEVRRLKILIDTLNRDKSILSNTIKGKDSIIAALRKEVNQPKQPKQSEPVEKWVGQMVAIALFSLITLGLTIQAVKPNKPVYKYVDKKVYVDRIVYKDKVIYKEQKLDRWTTGTFSDTGGRLAKVKNGIFTVLYSCDGLEFRSLIKLDASNKTASYKGSKSYIHGISDTLIMEFQYNNEPVKVMETLFSEVGATASMNWVNESCR